MLISLFDIVGPIMIGPSSSHTAGAARLGRAAFDKLGNIPEDIQINLFNSFADTGEGHGTDKAILAGCLGISCYDERLKESVEIAHKQKIKFKISKKHNPKYHPNTAEIILKYKKNTVHMVGVSLGGGRIAIYDWKDVAKVKYNDKKNIKKLSEKDVFYSFSGLIKKYNLDPNKLIDLVIEREMKIGNKTAQEISESMYEAWSVMKEGIESGISKNTKMFKGLCGGDAYRMNNNNNNDLLGKLASSAISYALAIGELNVGMGKIVAVPTAGSAGILPGCLYSLYKNKKVPEEQIIRALFISGIIGLVIANRATLAGSEGGCQAECGAASAMAAGAITYIVGGSLDEIDNAASIAMGNSLGLVCDPISGLVAVPCIHRNGIFTGVSFSAAMMALTGINFVVSFDEVCDTMMKVGRNIPCALRETSKGGLAITKTGIKYNKLVLSREHI